jgi:hypothetical protein
VWGVGRSSVCMWEISVCVFVVVRSVVYDRDE